MPSESRDATAHPTQRRFEVEGLGIAVRDYSRGTALDGPPILLLHGGMAHARWFDFMGPLLAPLGRPFAMDRRGHGESDWTEREGYGWERDVADIGEIARRLDEGPWVLVGHSQGGILAADLAARRGIPLRALVLLDVPLFLGTPAMRHAGERLSKIPQMHWPTLDAACAGFRPYPLPHLIPDGRLAQLARSSFKPNGEGGFTSRFHWKVFRADPKGGPGSGFAERIRRIAAPTLCLRGAASTILSADDHAETVRRIPLGQPVVIPAATHHLHVEQPHAVAGAIADFLSGIEEVPRLG